MAKVTPGQWITAVTNVAVLAGVLLVVFELRQDAELARLEMIQSRISAFQQAEEVYLDPRISQVWIKSFTDPGSMTLAEIRAMDSYMAIHINQMFREYKLEKAGLLDSGATSQLMQENFPFLFGSRFAKAWWAEFGVGWPSDFVEIASPIVNAVKDDELSERFSRLQQTISSE